MLTDLMLRLRSLVRRTAVEQELDDELQFHLDQQVAKYREQGFSHEEATRRAGLEFGGLDQIKEEHRDARGVRFVADLDRDLRYAARQLKRAPSFTVLAMLCLGLGIGVNTAIFGVINSTLFRSMPVMEPERLIRVTRAADGLPYPAFRYFQERTRTLSGLAAAFPMESDLEVSGDGSFVVAEVASVNYADVLGVKPMLGRWFANDSEPAAVISHAVWEHRFHLDPQVLGRMIWSESQSYTVVGVLPPKFTGVFMPMRTDIWVPIRTRPSFAPRLEDEKSTIAMMVFGRLANGATTAQTVAELNAIDVTRPREPEATSERVAPLAAEPVRGLPSAFARNLAQRLTPLMAGIVALILLIACVNVGNLLLVRGATRQREFAVRRALGASRFRLLQQLLIESVLLAAGGGICGLVLAMWTSRLLELSLPAANTLFVVQMDLSLDWRATVFATITSLVTTVACGLLPAWRTSRARGLVALKGEATVDARYRRPVGLVAQVAMSLVLLFVAGSFVQALLRAQVTNPGFAVDGRVYAHLLLPSPPFTIEGRRETYMQTLERLRALPGVRRVAMTSTLPLLPTGSNCATREGGSPVRTTSTGVGLDYFETMGIGLVSGRAFTTGDFTGSSTAIVVSEAFATRVWPEGLAIGESVMVGCNTPRAAIVIGVVRDSAIRDIAEVAQPHFYRPFVADDLSRLIAIVVNADSDAASLVQPVRQILRGLGEGSRVYAVQPLGDYVQQSLASVRWITTLLTSFGLLALLLAAVGLYGIVAYRVTQRTPEIGIRMALGASRGDVFREVLRYGLALVFVGIAIGEVLTLGVTGLLGSVQQGLRDTSTTTHLVVGLMWLAVAALACYLPAARASRVDPMRAVRHE